MGEVGGGWGSGCLNVEFECDFSWGGAIALDF